MMGLTRKGEYAIRAAIYLAQQQPDEVILISDISRSTEVPQSFLAKILQQLCKHNLVRSFRGSGGGFTLAREARTITLREVIEAVEGPIVPNRCLQGEGICDRDAHCQVHPVWREVQGQVTATLDRFSIAELASRERAYRAGG